MAPMNFLCVLVVLMAGATAHGGGRPVRPPHGPPGGDVPLWAKPLNPNNTGGLQLTPVFRADNITLPNVTLPLKQGESIFLLPTNRGPSPKHSGKPPLIFLSYVKIQCSTNSTTPLSFEFGMIQPRPSGLKAGSESDEDTLQ